MIKHSLLFLVMASFVACGPTRVAKNPDPVQYQEDVLLLDRAYKPYLNVVSQNVRKLESGQLEIIIEIQNTRNKDLWADVQTVFKDKDGIEVDKTNWEPIMFHRREVTTYKKVSLSLDAADYRLVIRKPKTEN